MPVPACGSGRAREGASSEAEPARGGCEPSSGAEPARGRCAPSSEAEPARGDLWVGRFGGPRGPPQRGPCPVCVLKWDAFSFGFLPVLSRVSPVVLGDPQGCPRQKAQDAPNWAHAWAALLVEHLACTTEKEKNEGTSSWMSRKIGASSNL
jgi:hypothetical protein